MLNPLVRSLLTDSEICRQPRTYVARVQDSCTGFGHPLGVDPRRGRCSMNSWPVYSPRRNRYSSAWLG